MPQALLIIDIQRDYFPGGAFPLVEPEAAAAHAAELLAAFRAAGGQVVHMQHVAEEPDAAFMRAGSLGVEIHDLVAPTGDELVLTKAAPNSFLHTALHAELTGRGIDELVVSGMMSSMCVDATVRAAADLGYSVQVAHDACAAPDLEFGDHPIPGATVHAAFMAALGDGYAKVLETGEICRGLS